MSLTLVLLSLFTAAAPAPVATPPHADKPARPTAHPASATHAALPSEERPVLFAVLCGSSPREKCLGIEPILLLSPIEAPPPNISETEPSPAESAAFRDQYFKPGARYYGVSKTPVTLTVDAPVQLACVSLSAAVHAGGAWQQSLRFATNDPRLVHAERPVSSVGEEEKKALEKFISQEPGERTDGGDDSPPDSASWSRVRLGPGEQEYIIGTMTSPDRDLGYGELNTLLLLRRERSGYTVAYSETSHSPGGDDAWGSWGFVGAIDVDGDGVAEVVLIVSGKEGYHYQVLQHEPTGWKALTMARSGSGC